MDFKNLKEKFNYYRSLTDYKLIPNGYIMLMLDGRAFSKIVKKKFKLPFDDDFINMMNQTALFLCENIQGSKIAYVQSDEISILISDISDNHNTDLFFSGRLCKIQSIAASLATCEFNKLLIQHVIKLEKNKNESIENIIKNIKLVQFDCKCWNLPNEKEVFSSFLYRQLDCIKNSKQQTAQTYIPHKELLGKNADEQIAMCNNRCIVDWNMFENRYKYGRFIAKEETTQTKVVKGETVTFTRNKFSVIEAFPLNDNKDKFFELWKLN